MASRAPAWRVAFSTKRKAMDLPSGDHWSVADRAVQMADLLHRVGGWGPDEDVVLRVACQSPSLPEQSERNASCLPSGDQAGWEEAQAPGVVLATLPTVSGEIIRSGAVVCAPSGAMLARCNSEPRGRATAQATVLPSGEMAAEVGARTWLRESSREAMRASSEDADGVVWDDVAADRQTSTVTARRYRVAVFASSEAGKVIPKRLARG
jgi:predicted RecA/RadA family phage recombinase